MAIAFVQAWSNATPGTGSLSIGPSSGNFCIAAACADTLDVFNQTPPSGWTEDADAGMSSTFDNGTMYCCSKVSDGTETSITFSHQFSVNYICAVVEYSGVDTTTPRDTTPITKASSSSTATHTSNSITPVTDGCMIVHAFVPDGGTGNPTFGWSTSSGTTGSWTSQVDISDSGFYQLGFGDAPQTTAGAVVGQVTTTGYNSGTLSCIYALRPGSTGTIDQSAFRFWNDDAAEASMTGAAAENTNLTATANTKKILRVEVETNGDMPSSTYKWKYQANGTGGYADLPVGATTDVVASPTTDAGTTSGNNTATSSWTTVAVPSYASGALVIIGIAWDDSTNVTSVTPPSGPNSETLTAINATPATNTGTTANETRCQVWYYVSTASYAGGNLTFTPSASEQWTAVSYAIAANNFDGTTPIGASTTNGASADGSNVQGAAFSAGASDGGGRLFHFCSVDTDPSTVATGFTQVGNQDIGAVSGGLFSRDTVVTDSESISATTSFVVRPYVRTNDWYIDASSNIADAGTDATTNRLTTSSKTFQAGTRIDSGYSSAPSHPAIDITTDYQSEFDVCINSRSGLANGQYAEFRLYKGDTAFAAYDYTPKWTIGSPGTDITPTQGNLSLSGTAPTVDRTTNADITPSQGNLALSGTAPGVSQQLYRDAPQGNLVITTTVPTVDQTAHISLTPSQGNLVLSGTAPTIDQTAHHWAYPAQADLTLSGTAPTVSTGAHIALSPDQANLALSTTAPTVDRTAHISLSPAQSNLSLSTFAPEIQAGGNVGKSPASADLVLSATAPTVGATANVNIGPASADIVLSTFAPTIDSGVAVVVTPRPSGGGRVIGYSPPLRLKKKKVTVLLPQDNDELIRRLREIDAGYQKRRQEQLQDLLASMRHALMWGQEVTLQGYDLLTRADIEATRRKVQQEEESLLLLLQ